MMNQVELLIELAEHARAKRKQYVLDDVNKARQGEARDRSGFATELAGEYGFAYIDDDAEYMVCSIESLTDLMSVLGFRTREESQKKDAPLYRAWLVQQPHPECYETWIYVGKTLHRDFEASRLGLELWHEWSKQADNYSPEALAEKWKQFSNGKGK